MRNDDPLGAAQLLQHVIRLRPDDRNAKLRMADALRLVGEPTFDAPLRNYALSTANRIRSQAVDEQESATLQPRLEHPHGFDRRGGDFVVAVPGQVLQVRKTLGGAALRQDEG